MFLTGCWLGEDFQPVLSQRAKWVMNRRADGTFSITFIPEDGPVQREEGTWSQHGKSYTTVTTTIDGRPVDVQDPIFTDTYDTRWLDNDVMESHHKKANMVFKSRKMPCDGGDGGDG
ncbi:hypothetical protein ACQQ2N_06170 [Dokdonella sp. MW10]|uniref:hypothetical protein n=1 Tax=Dokdonella sp. MW10 TaxID=2992926 RepID=UPI003F800DEE